MSADGRDGIRKLTDMQGAWVNAYLGADIRESDLKRAQTACRAAGYSEASVERIARRMLNNPHVMREMRRKRFVISGASEVTQEQVVEGLLGIATDPAAKEQARVSAWAYLGRHTGGFEAKSNVDHSGELTITRGTPSLSNKEPVTPDE